MSEHEQRINQLKTELINENIDLALISEHTAEQAAQAAETNANIAAIDASSGYGDKKEVDDASETE